MLSKLLFFLFSDKSVRVSGNVALNEEAISESEHRPRPPVTATEIPPRPRPSPSPSKAKQTLTTSPVKQFDMMESFNPLVTKGATVPQNTPEKKQVVSNSKQYCAAGFLVL
jgi:hypothetical protein